MFCPKVLQPVPDQAFVRELRSLDPDLRVVWGFERYLLNRWTIERKIDPERRYHMFKGVLDGKIPRFVQQPIYDTDQPILDEWGDEAGFKIVGYREYDCAPEWEWMRFVEEKGEYAPLDSRVLLDLRREYAWNLNQPLTRQRVEKELEEEERRESLKKKRLQIAFDELGNVKRELGISKQI